ncbi:MAG TPA: amidase, partial [Nocardioidaceae bacterium]|nr:amidase [Nocardioidaceae bacterium]
SLMAALDVYSSARAMAAAVAAKQVSARELLDLHLERIEQTNPRVNAVVSLDPDRAREQAAAADQKTASGAELGPLHGLPFAFKDTHEVAGWRTTFGSPLRRDYVSKRDELLAERVRAAGALVIGKTNVPEWAAGSHTFNPIFGTTRNPYDLSRSAGGSSGGAAAALAAGMVPLADGSDMGGSLRNPASFCNVVGLRPSVGRVPTWPTANAWELTSVSGPMARSVEDLALLLSVLAGPSTRARMSLETPGSAFAPPLEGSLDGLRVALSVDLGGAFEVDRGVAGIVSDQGRVLADGGAKVEEDHPDLTGADRVFRTLRAWQFWALYGSMLERHPDAFKPSLADNIRAGQDLTGADVSAAYQRMTSLAEKIRVFFSKYDVLVLPVSQVPPFDAEEEFPAEVNGRPQATYLDWMRSAYLLTVTGCPAISVPAGFTPEGWPVGIQVVAAPRAERRLLEVAHAYEQLTRVGERRPAL